MVTKEGRVREKVEGREEERQGIWEAEWEGKPCPLALDYISQSHRVQDTASFPRESSGYFCRQRTASGGGAPKHPAEQVD